MPLYRIPETNELINRSASYDPGSSGFGQSLLDVRLARPRKFRAWSSTAANRQGAQRHHPRRQDDAVNQSRQQNHVADHTIQERHIELLRSPEQGGDEASHNGLIGTQISNLRRHKKRRRKPSPDALRALAFYSMGDPVMSPVWEKYAAAFMLGRGQVFGVRTQAEAAKRLSALRDTDVERVFFVGHGLSSKIKGYPCFMLSGTMVPGGESGHIYSAGSETQLIKGADGPLVRALAPHLALDRQVLVAFLACRCGEGSVLQAGFASAVTQAEPDIDVRVEGYASLYMTEKVDGSNQAFLAEELPPLTPQEVVQYRKDNGEEPPRQHDRLKALSIVYKAPERPISQLVVEAKSAVFIEPTLPDDFAGMDWESNDPLAGLNVV